MNPYPQQFRIVKYEAGSFITVNPAELNTENLSEHYLVPIDYDIVRDCDIINFIDSLTEDNYSYRCSNASIIQAMLPQGKKELLRQKGQSKVDCRNVKIYLSKKFKKTHSQYSGFSKKIFEIRFDSTLTFCYISIYNVIRENLIFDDITNSISLKRKLSIQEMVARDDIFNKLRRSIGCQNSKSSFIFHDHYSPLFSIRTRQRQTERESRMMTLKEALQRIPGKIFLTFANDNRSTKYIVDYDGPKTIRSITIVYHWVTPELINSIEFLSLDASWKPTSPYAYCIILGCRYNHSIPLGVNIEPTETTGLYANAMDRIQYQVKLMCEEKRIPYVKDLRSFPIISDQGTALASLSSSPFHFICHHHFIKKFGANSIASIYVNKILEASYSAEEWKQKIPLIKDEIASIQDVTDVKHFKEIQEMCNVEPTDQMKKWLLYERMKYGVPKTQNFSESAHSRINAEFNGRTAKIKGWKNKFIQGILSIVHVNTVHVLNIEKYYYRTIVERIKHEKRENADQFPGCNCSENQWNQSIYGFKLPCKHVIANVEINEIKHLVPLWPEAFAVSKSDLLTAKGVIEEPIVINAPLKLKKKYKFNKQSVIAKKSLKANSLYPLVKNNPIAQTIIEIADRKSVV